MLTVKTYDRQSSAFNEAELFLFDIAQTISTDRLSKNYTPSRMKMDSTIGISLLFDNDKPVGFSTVLLQPIFGNAARILNRFYKSPAHRGNDRRITPETVQMIDQQIELVRDHGLSFAFMSREGASPTALNNYTKQLSDDWVVSPHRHQVCDAGVASCYQRVAYLDVQGGNDFSTILSNRMTEQEYADRFLQ